VSKFIDSSPDAGEGRSGGETFASIAYQRLRQDIISARYPFGGKLRIQDLCERYRLGPSPIREALNRLSRDGLVTLNDHKGFSVAPLSRAHLDELTRTRCWLNAIALRESIARGDTAWEESVVLAYHRLSRAPRHLGQSRESAYDPGWEQAHRAFHASLIAACGSRWLIAFCEQLFDAADCYRHLSRQTSRRRGLVRDEHQALRDAVLARDADAAIALMNAHFTRTADLVRDGLEE
jgi:GntR family transcriptional regulator, carbon starvation induced regulator